MAAGSASCPNFRRISWLTSRLACASDAPRPLNSSPAVEPFPLRFSFPTVMGFGSYWHLPLSLSLAALLSGCVLAPKEAKQEQLRLDEAGKTYSQPFAKRELPELPAQPTWREVLRRAFLTNGELEAAYWEWAMAVSRIQQAGSYPNSPVSVGFEYMFSDESMKAWDRTTISAGFDAGEKIGRASCRERV